MVQESGHFQSDAEILIWEIGGTRPVYKVKPGFGPIEPTVYELKDNGKEVEINNFSNETLTLLYKQIEYFENYYKATAIY